MTQPIVPDPQVNYLEYAWMGLVALAGSIARAGKWVDDQGKFIISKLITELASAFVFGVLAVSIGAYLQLKPEIVGGLAGAMGLMGAATVIGFVQNFFSARFGGKSNASDPKAAE
jgi:hypothetical protein